MNASQNQQADGLKQEKEAIHFWLYSPQNPRLRPQQIQELAVQLAPIRQNLQAEVERLKRDLYFAKLPWWRKDRTGWPIETFRGQPVKSALRIVCQNIKKLWWRVAGL